MKLNFYRDELHIDMVRELKTALAGYKNRRSKLIANTLYIPVGERELFEEAAKKLNLEIIEDKELKPRYYMLDKIE